MGQKIMSLRDGEYTIDVHLTDTEAGDFTPAGKDIPNPRITIPGWVSPFEFAWILMHEIDEYLKWVNQVRLAHKGLDDMARGRTRLFRNNPKLVRYFLRDGKEMAE